MKNYQPCLKWRGFFMHDEQLLNWVLVAGCYLIFVAYLFLLMMNEYEIFDACRKGDVAMAEQLCKANPAVINSTDIKGFTPLILAVYNDQPEAVDFLLANGADVDAQDGAGNTALMGACFKGYQQMAKKLLEAGADVNIRNVNGAPALTFAATFGQLQIAEWLLQKGAATNLPDTRGKTSLDHAVIQENEPMIVLLEQYS